MRRRGEDELGHPVEHGGLWWSTNPDGLVVWRRDETDEWQPWDPDEMAQSPPPGLMRQTPRDQVASGVNAIYWLILAIAVIAGATIIVDNLSEASKTAEREACELAGLRDC